MLTRFIILVALAPLLINSGAAAQPAKALAAAPQELEGGHLRLPDPAQGAMRSQAAAIPIKLSQRGPGFWSAEISFPVEPVSSLSLMLFAPDRENWDITIQPAGGEVLRWREAVSQAGVKYRAGDIGLGKHRYPGELLGFTNPADGSWTLRVQATRGGRDVPADGYLIAVSNSPYRMLSQLTSYDLHQGRPVGFEAHIYDQQDDDEASLPNMVDSAFLRLMSPDGTLLTLPMNDDGWDGDMIADDGRFTGQFIPDHTGEYRAQVVIEGTTPDDQPFHRTTEHVFPVISANFGVGDGRLIVDTDNRLILELDVEASDAGMPDTRNRGAMRMTAELWGSDQNGKAVPVAWVAGMVEAQMEVDNKTVLRLEVDRRWLERAGAAAPFALKALRIDDRDTHIPLTQAENIELSLNGSLPPRDIKGTRTPISLDMLTGRRPAASETKAQSNSTNAIASTDSRLILVHGYCSGGSSWPTEDFTDFAVFHDPGQNRSHDEFARILGTFGAQYGSFGTVAHSQGGDASLHLYTYYWSGLDFSTGSRLIQSVGTPYQGTSLAGLLALLGEIFGLGCGTNWDLTYDGAALWLSGIPDWARQRVYYWTTSFDTAWWRIDYCNLATDLVLSDPEDGVVEQWAGQLVGGNNMGHKTGWCHTFNMRDPAQVLDTVRNQEMNFYGNR